MGAVELPKAIAFEFILADEMRVAMAEDSMDDLLGLDIILQVNVPNLLCYLLVDWITGVGHRQGNDLLECVVEVLLVVMEGRVAILLYFLGWLLMGFRLTSSRIFKMASVNDSWLIPLQIAGGWLLLFLEEVEKLRDVIHGIFPIEV